MQVSCRIHTYSFLVLNANFQGMTKSVWNLHFVICLWNLIRIWLWSVHAGKPHLVSFQKLWVQMVTEIHQHWKPWPWLKGRVLVFFSWNFMLQHIPRFLTYEWLQFGQNIHLYLCKEPILLSCKRHDLINETEVLLFNFASQR